MSKITILIPTYNRASLIAKTIENCFLQSCGDFTILIYDDGSTDNTTDVVNSIIKRYPNRIKYIKSKKNMGIGYSRKMLLEHLNSEFGVWLDIISVSDCPMPDVSKIIKSNSAAFKTSIASFTYLDSAKLD